MLQCCAVGRKQAQNDKVCQTARDFLAGLIIFIAVFSLAALDSGPARPQTAAASAAQSGQASQQARSMTPAQMRSGGLLVRPAGTGRKESFLEARLLGTDISITVDGPVARATVIQTFRNTGEHPVDGLYVFPLPGDAAVDTLDMQIGERSIAGEIKSRAEAQALYAQARQAGAKPAPAELRHSNIFTNAVTNIAPGETVTVRIEYQERLHRSGGAYSLRFPLAAAAQYAVRPQALGVRYEPGAQAAGDERMPDPAPGKDGNAAAANPVSLQVRLQAGFPLGPVESANHTVDIKRVGDDSAVLTLHGGQAPQNRDFVLNWAPSAIAQPAMHLFRQGQGTSEYMLAMITPPPATPDMARRPREVVFLIDSSGSMAGSSILQVREALESAISRLDANDRFNIIAFDAGYEKLFKAPVAANTEDKAIARQFIARLIASGGTEMIRPLSTALKDSQPDDTSRVRQVVLITDGTIANAQKLFSEIAVQRGRSRLFLIGLGPAPETGLLRRAAEVGRGGFIHIDQYDQIGARIDGFLKGLERPAITDMKVEWPKGVRAESWPDPLPDIYAGQPLVISARTETALKGKLTVTGTFAGKPWSHQIDLATASRGEGVARLWARRKIASLESNAFYASDNGGDIGAQIEKVALAHQIVSPMTSLVAVERTPAPINPARRPVAGDAAPAGLLAGWVHQNGFGNRTLAAQRRPAPKTRGFTAPAAAGIATAGAAAPAQTTVAAQASSRPVQIAQASGRKTVLGVTRTQSAPAAQGGSFFSGRVGIIAIMALLFATMSAVTLGLWRQFGRLQSSDRHKRRGV